ncbi:MAG: hypothetical protein LKF79_01770 [Solobacterium sp.]|jgi:hypothetical protein|nr:hypothetical protein [Solobacterium sp.]MCH4222253.1 hypothetical protein [Solobacterium sp.]MCH4265356.1 hypothetical protein [Solobacterium sp.]
MKKSLILPSICIFAGIALTVISFIVLPNNVVTQFSIGGGGVTTTPKILAVAISAVIAIGGGFLAVSNVDDSSKCRRSMLVSVIGIAVFVVMLIINR